MTPHGRPVYWDVVALEGPVVENDGDVNTPSAEAHGNEPWGPIRWHFTGTMDVPVAA